MTFKPKKMGSWYDNDYMKQINMFKNDESQKYNVKCIVVPHAGYAYTNLVMSETYSKVKWDNVNQIFLLCTLHEWDDAIFLPQFSKVSYPTGEINVNVNIINELMNTRLFKKDDDVYNKEHSFEMQMPYVITYAKPGTNIIPLIVGNIGNFINIANILKKYDSNKTLFIVSTDFTHFGMQYEYIPVNKDIKEFILNKDMNNIRDIFDNKVEIFKQNLTICGANALMLWLHINMKKWNGSVVAYMTSGDDLDSNDASFASVSYVGAIFCEEKVSNNIEKFRYFKKMKIMVDEGGKVNLKQMCKDVSLMPRVIMMLKNKYGKVSKELLEGNYDDKRGIFVTLEDNGRLKGCIGSFYDENNGNFYGKMMRDTLLTVYDDNRFDNILRYKRNHKHLYASVRLNFKVNMLSKEFKVDNFWSMYKPCVHGIILKYNGSSSTFLPSVMLDQGWIKNCGDVGDKKKFENAVFGALLKKMGHNAPNTAFGALLKKMGHNVAWSNVKNNVEISLYEGHETSESKMFEMSRGGGVCSYIRYKCK